MRLNKLPAFLLAFLIMIVMVPGFASAVSAEEETVINIYHTNDIHGHAVGNETSIGYARFRTMLKEDGADGRLVLDAGNAFSGTAFANLSDGQSIASLMEQVGYDGISPGNHDFDYGSGTLEQLLSDFGINGLAINILKDGQPVFEPYRIFQESGIKIGVIGIATPETEETGDPRDLEGLTFLGGDPLLTSVQSAVNDLRAQNVNAVVVLSHLGTSDHTGTSSVDVATKVSGIDLIIDGHSHDTYETGYISYPGYIQGRTPMIVQTGKYFENFGIASLTFDSKKVLVGVSERLVDAEEASDFSPDKSVAETIIDYEKQQQPIMAKNISSTPVFLNAEPAYLLTGSTNFGQLCTQAMLADTGADIALISSGIISGSIPAGPISFGTLYNALPYDNYIVTTKITGAELKKLLNTHMLLGNSSFPQFAGFEIVAQKYLNDDGETAAAIQTLTKDGKEVADTDNFTIAVPDFIYYGGDGYEFSSPVLQEGSTLFSAVTDYLNSKSGDEIEALSASSNLTIWEETIDADNVVAKLEADVPEDVHIYLNQAAVVPENVIYSLIGKDCNLIFTVNGERPYSFIFNGTELSVPMNINLAASVSQDPPQGKRTASSADKNAVFLNLARNDSLPPDTDISIYVGDVYPPGSFVYLYYYDMNRDILPLDEKGIEVDEAGNVTFPANSGVTYLLNSKLLNAATIFENPTAEHPFVLGIVVLVVLFAVWVIFFLITKKGAQKHDKQQ
ncbi:bifunctional metallophosphatase/5'-nucleotidase [Christensenella tenuis]|uniref:Bifunctional metallophosphatase/5'-nucleotidase n=1 Tax=Christensenella tenuis TaxID=2763033 RepID=A0ABR7EHW5_9FIRM|nr:bifunctional UDP-sugar hydrolase/5'-nucleotidase [Christensenella tenuis]MBC5649334.1 bifunctional metallophosphatase/5'-nucleotidase [Christensenella tenuis]